MTTSLERRKEVLALAREHNFLILEGLSSLRMFIHLLMLADTDDPYYFLYFGKSPRPPSYFNLELEEPEVGRVLRFDSLSKILSAGIRVGFASGPQSILAAIDQHVSDRVFSYLFALGSQHINACYVDVHGKFTSKWTSHSDHSQITGILGIRWLLCAYSYCG